MGKKEMLLDRLGGQDALRAAVDGFYARLIADERLKEYFEGVNIKLLKWHQYNFMSIAFTEIPEDMDVALLISEKHARLFDMGLDETHFDIVAGHFVATLESLGVKQPEIDEAVSVIAPLRACFVQGAIEAKQRKKNKRITQVVTATTVIAVVAAIGAGLVKK